jgi:hypothetical protein
VTAPAQEPKGEEVKTEKEQKLRTCLICGTELKGNFCSVCNMSWDEEG